MKSTKNKTDLGVAPVLPVLDGPHTGSSVPASHGEGICTNPKTGEPQGNIYLFRDDGALARDARFREEIAATIRSAGASVCRIFVICHLASDPSKKRIWVGSGFLVAPDVIATAQHVVKDSHGDQPEGVFNREKLFVTFRVDARLSARGYDPIGQPHEEGLIQAVVLPKVVDSIATLNNQWLVPSNGGMVNWENINDFAFLQLPPGSAENLSPILPELPSNFGSQVDAVTIAYPGSIERVKFAEDYTTLRPSEVDSLYDFVVEKTEHFERKIFSTGTFGKVPQSSLFAHSCPTIRGTSGGFFGVLKAYPDGPKFLGVHIGGDVDINNNFAVVTSEPSFVIEYLNAVPAAFIRSQPPLTDYFKEVKAILEQHQSAIPDDRKFVLQL